MKTIQIIDITKNNVERVFEELSVSLPSIPAGGYSFKCHNPTMLWIWKCKFEEKYGTNGTLLLDFETNGQVEDNENYNRAIMATNTGMYERGYIR